MKPLPRNRKTTSRILLGISGICILLGFLLWHLNARDSNLPIYQGKTVEEWFYGEDGNPGNRYSFFDAKLAFQALGEISVPFLIEKLREKESALNSTYCNFYPKLPITIKKWFPFGITKDQQKSYAWVHLRSLPITALKGFEKQLLEIYNETQCNNFLSAEFELTSSLARRITDQKLRKDYYLNNLNSKDPAIQLRSSINLSKMDTKITNTLPVLMSAVTNDLAINVWFDRIKHGATLDSFDRMIKRQQKQAYEALQRIAPELAKQHPIPIP